jgi:hypothetical protein
VKRRPLTVAALVIALLAGWLTRHLSGRLSAGEQWLVGVWQSEDRILRFDADRRYVWSPPFGRDWHGTWQIRRGRVELEDESRVIRRLLRPVSKYLGVSVVESSSFRLTPIGNDQFELAWDDGTRRIWTRITAQYGFIGQRSDEDVP